MKSSWLLIASVAATVSCTVGKSAMTLDVDKATVPADGTTAQSVRVCNTSDEPSDKLTVTLTANAGKWARASADAPLSLKVDLTKESTCSTESWIPPQAAGSIRFEANVSDVVQARKDVEAVPAKVTAIEILANPPTLDSKSDETSELKISVRATTDPVGIVTNGTRFDVSITGSDPVGAAVLSDNSVVSGTRPEIDLRVAAGAKAVRIIAKSTDVTMPVTACKIITPLGGATELSCP